MKSAGRLAGRLGERRGDSAPHGHLGPQAGRLAALLAALSTVFVLPTAPASGAPVEPGTASLEVRVTDARGAAVAGAEVTVSSPGSGRRGTVWNDAQAAATAGPAFVRFDALPSGSWSVRVEAVGFGPVERGVRLEPGEVVRLEAVLVPAPGAGASTLRVSGRHRPSIGSPIGPDRLRELPSSRNVWSLLETFEPVAIVDRQDNGGLYAGEAGRVLAHGASWTQTSFRFAGLDATDPDRTGIPLFSFPYDAFQALDLTTGMLPVESGGPGPLLVLEPRRPGGRWRGTLLGSLVPGRLQSSNGRPGAPSIARFESWWEAGAALGGPLVADRLGLFVATGLMRSRRLERDATAPLEGETRGGLAHLVFRRDDEELRLLAGLQRAEYPFAGRARFAGDPEQRDSFSQVQATWERRPGSGSRWAVSAGWFGGRFEPDLAGAAPSAVERIVDGRVRQLVAPADAARRRLGLEVHWSPDLRDLHDGRHAMRAGVGLSRNRSDTRPASEPLPIPELVGGRPARVWDYAWAGPESRWRSTELAAWVADRVAVGQRLGIEAGLRLDLVDASNDAAGEITWASLSPRLSFRWDLGSDGEAVLFGGYARYRHRLPLSVLAHGDPAGPQGAIYRWEDRDDDRVFDPGERGVLVARSGPGGASLASIDPDLERPYTDELVLGLEGRLPGGVTARVTAVARRERDLLESVNVGVPESSYEVFFVPDPSGDFEGPADDQLLPIFDRRPASFGLDRYLLTNPAGHSSRHQGIEFVLEKRWGEAARLHLGATAHRSEGSAANVGFRSLENDQGVVGELFDQPNAGTFARGRLFSDRAYTGKIAASARLPWNVLAAAVGRYQDGQPFARLVVAEGLNQGPELVRGVANGRHRFTFALTVDVRLEKRFRVGGGHLAAVIEAFNLLNTANEVEENPITGELFRRETAVQPPRAVRLGVRLDF